MNITHDTNKGKPKYLKENLSQCQFVHDKFHMEMPGIHCYMLAANHMCHGTADTSTHPPTLPPCNTYRLKKILLTAIKMIQQAQWNSTVHHYHPGRRSYEGPQMGSCLYS